MIIVISLYKACHEILRKILDLRMYHAQDVALCTDTSIQHPLPLRCYASYDICLIYSPTIREMHYIMGSLYTSLHALKTFLYVLPMLPNTQNTHKLCAAHSVQNSSGQRVYIDMLHAWYTDEIELINDSAYEFIMLTQRFWQSHHAHVMLIPQDYLEDNKQNNIESKQQEITNAFTRLQSMPMYNTGKNCHSILQTVHASLRCSFTQQKQLYNALHTQEMRHGQISQQLKKNIDEIIHAATHNSTALHRKTTFRTLLHAITEYK